MQREAGLGTLLLRVTLSYSTSILGSIPLLHDDDKGPGSTLRTISVIV